MFIEIVKIESLANNSYVVSVCAAGMRATSAGSILQRDGRDNVQVLDGTGTSVWITGLSCGHRG